jgi:LPXTG-motif cell wall-anchored protein
MSTNRLARTSFLTVLAGLVGAMALLVAPASALESGGAKADDNSVASGTAVAKDDSVASGSGVAIDDSTASGSAVAIDGSTASGCSTAIDESTASGAPCPRDRDHDKDKDKGKDKVVHKTPAKATGIGGGTPARATTARSLAVTGTDAETMATAAGAMLLFGSALVVASRRRSTN